MLEDAFSKREPLFNLSVYYPYKYYLGDDPDIDAFEETRRRMVVSLIRTQFLKRFESSIFLLRCPAIGCSRSSWRSSTCIVTGTPRSASSSG